MHYVPSCEPFELSLQNKWIQNRNNDLDTKR